MTSLNFFLLVKLSSPIVFNQKSKIDVDDGYNSKNGYNYVKAY